MISRPQAVGLAQRILGLIAVVFGLATVISGGRVLLGADPGYVVFRPLLIYNTLMGMAYLTAGVTIWGDVSRGVYAAAAIFGLNVLVLGAIGVVYAMGSGVAIDSLRAMTFRTAVWLVVWLAAGWLGRAREAPSRS